MVYEHVRVNTWRGRFLSEAPLVLIGISADGQSVCLSEDCVTHIILHSGEIWRERKDTLGNTGIWLSSALLLGLTANAAISHNAGAFSETGFIYHGGQLKQWRSVNEESINDHLSQW